MVVTIFLINYFRPEIYGEINKNFHFYPDQPQSSSDPFLHRIESYQGRGEVQNKLKKMFENL